VENCWPSGVPPFIEFVGPHHSLQILGIRLVGFNSDTGRKVLFSLIFLTVVWLVGRLLKRVTRSTREDKDERRAFWVRQGISIAVALTNLVGLLSIWFDDPTRLATAAGLVTAGLAFALQRVVTAFAGYILILRGKTFNVGDRITMGGIRGDVIGLGFFQTVIMEMGQPPDVRDAEPAMWVRARQYTGRIVSVTNAKIFDEPVYNYTREFPFLWEEIRIPIGYTSDRTRAEQILLDAVRTHTTKIAEIGEAAVLELERRYFVQRSELEPKAYVRLTDNWVEIAVRFIVQDHGVREVKNRISRDILDDLEKAGISIASGTYEIVGMPALRVQLVQEQAGNGTV
jgi:small-conductance mechanosensitive channel